MITDLIFNLKLSQIVDSPTHIQGNTLDLVLTNLEDSIHSLIVHNNNHQFILSDHIQFHLQYLTVRKPLIITPMYVYDFLKRD